MVYDLWILTVHHPSLVTKMVEYANLSGNTTFLGAFTLLGGLLQAPDRWRRLVTSRMVQVKDKTGKSYDVIVDPETSFIRPKPIIDLTTADNRSDVDSFDIPNMVGQLSFKNEPAGKVRVFAMVDS